MAADPPGAPLVLYDSVARAATEFRPIDENRVGMYSCGPTVYDRAHLGNLRAYVFADTVRRALLWKGYAVRHVINITDVGHLLADADLGDDKVEAAARRERRSVWDLTAHYTRVFQDDLAALRCLPPACWPTATDHVAEMIDFARALEERGHTYRLDSGLYFDTSTLPGYGQMATMHHDTGPAAARIEAVAGKRQPADFALWRTFAPDDPPRAMEWDSPWGRGAPGWHLECSVMAIGALGRHFDIHTGGVDHREVHHPNEDAQSRAFLADGEPWVGRWMHVEFLQFEGGKMAKSTGNVLDLDDVRRLGADPLAFRLLVLAAHYRSQITAGRETLAAAGTRYARLVDAVARRTGAADDRDEPPGGGPDPSRPLVTVADALDRLPEGSAGRAVVERMDAAISDDLATPAVLAALDDALRDGAVDPPALAVVLDVVRTLLGLDLLAAATARARRRAADLPEHMVREIERLVAERDAARRARDFARADALRDALREDHGVTVIDGPEGTTWRLDDLVTGQTT